MRVESGARAIGRHCSGKLKAYPTGDAGNLCKFFLERKGIVIDKTMKQIGEEACKRKFTYGQMGGLFAKITDFYGLDIRKIRKKRWVLAGEWFGTEYKDYIAERINDAKTT